MIRSGTKRRNKPFNNPFIGLWVTIIYLIKVALSQITKALRFYKRTAKLKIIIKPVHIVYTIIAAVLGLFGKSLLDLPDFFSRIRPFLDWAALQWVSIPLLVRWLIIGLVLLGIILAIIKQLLSKERLFKIATKRLRDQVDPSARATEYNEEANELIYLIDHGKKNDLAYDFLTNLWKKYILDHSALTLLDLPTDGSLRPIVCVDIQHIPCDPEHPEEQLNSLIKVHNESVFKDYSGREMEQSRIRYLHQKIPNRQPLTRYLSRYRGPSEQDVGFRDDYMGYNACLKSMNFKDGKLVLPIECTMELYGNIMDSCDAMINELYLHFAFDEFTAGIDPEIILNFLPWRKALHKRYKDPIDILTQVNGRAAGFGISALTVFNRYGEFVAARGERATKVGTFPNVYHVIPSGMTNIKMDDPQGNRFLLPNGFLNIQLLFEKEFMEEGFSKDWAKELKTTGAFWPTVVKDAVKEHLYGNTGEYETKIYLTGIVFDLLNYRPEVCALILIKNQQWWSDHDPYKQDSPKEKWTVSSEWSEAPGIGLYDKDDVMPPKNSVPAGIAAYTLGVKKALTLLNLEDKL